MIKKRHKVLKRDHWGKKGQPRMDLIRYDIDYLLANVAALPYLRRRGVLVRDRMRRRVRFSKKVEVSCEGAVTGFEKVVADFEKGQI